MASLAVSSSPSSRMHVSGSPDACDCKTTQVRQAYQLKNCKTLTTVSASLDCLWHIRNQLGVFLSSQAARDGKTLRTEHRFQKICAWMTGNHWKESTSTTYLDLLAEEHAFRRSVFMFSMEVWCTQRCSAC